MSSQAKTNPRHSSLRAHALNHYTVLSQPHREEASEHGGGSGLHSLRGSRFLCNRIVGGIVSTLTLWLPWARDPVLVPIPHHNSYTLALQKFFTTWRKLCLLSGLWSRPSESVTFYESTGLERSCLPCTATTEKIPSPLCGRTAASVPLISFSVSKRKCH